MMVVVGSGGVLDAIELTSGGANMGLDRLEMYDIAHLHINPYL